MKREKSDSIHGNITFLKNSPLRNHSNAIYFKKLVISNRNITPHIKENIITSKYEY